MRSKRLKQGVTVRSRLFGTQYAESALTGGDPLNREVQDLITEFGYGAVWARPGLPVALRSMLTLALLAALNRPEQLKAHLDGARKVGVTRRQIVEIFIHVILYAGAPAGLGAVKLAMEAFREWDETERPRRAARRKTPLRKKARVRRVRLRESTGRR